MCRFTVNVPGGIHTVLPCALAWLIVVSIAGPASPPPSGSAPFSVIEMGMGP